MGIYLSIFIILILLLIQYDFNNKYKGGDFCYWIVCVILILVAGFRYRVGGDTLSYFDDYDTFPTLSEFITTDFSLLKYQPLFYVLVALCKLISPDFYVFQLLQASIVTFVSFWFIKIHVKYKFLAALLWYYAVYFYFNMEIMRESLCVSIWLLAVIPMLQKRYIMYYFWATIAFLIHLSAFLLFFMPFVYVFMQRDWKSLILMFGFMTFCFIFIMVNPYMFIGLLPLKILLKVLNYGSLSFYVPTIIMHFIHILAILMIVKIHEKFYPDKSYFLPFLKFSIVILASTTIIYNVDRLINYFIIFEIILLVNVLSILQIYNVKKIQLSCLKVFVSFLLFVIVKSYYFLGDTSDNSPNTRFYNRYIPYESIFVPQRHIWRENIYYNFMYDWNRNLHIEK